jgi:hypothetical protein
VGKSKAPKPPDPKDTSAAATGTNVSTAIANSYLNNADSYTPEGSVKWTDTGTKDVTDPYTGKTYQVPIRTSTTTLSEAQQGIYDTNNQTEQNLANVGRDQSAKIGGLLGTNADLSSGNVEKYITDHFSDDFNKQWTQNQGSLESQLAQRGVKMGSAAYSRALEDFNSNKASAYDNMYGNQYDRATQSIMTERNAPINEISALLSGTQVSNPQAANINQSAIPTTDVAGIISDNYQQKLQRHQANNQNILGGLFGLGSAFLGNPALKFSDRRLKTDIRKVGKTDDGQNIYSYRYKTGGLLELGLMAQEVEKKHPDAVVETDSGFKAVDYSKALS